MAYDSSCLVAKDLPTSPKRHRPLRAGYALFGSCVREAGGKIRQNQSALNAVVFASQLDIDDLCRPRFERPTRRSRQPGLTHTGSPTEPSSPLPRELRRFLLFVPLQCQLDQPVD